MILIGEGERLPALQEYVRANHLGDVVEFRGFQKPEAVRDEMERADIFLFTSDYQEGWGAVLNESMNSGCAVVASHAVGAVPFLIHHGENGLIYKSGHWKDCYSQVKYLLDHPAERNRISQSAIRTMEEVWNPEVVAGKLYGLLLHLQQDGGRSFAGSVPGIRPLERVPVLHMGTAYRRLGSGWQAGDVDFRPGPYPQGTLVRKPLISIIVPVYNVKDYLARCVDSICGQ